MLYAETKRITKREEKAIDKAQGNNSGVVRKKASDNWF